MSEVPGINELPYPKFYLYRRIVQAKLYIDSHFADNLDLDDIADEACFSKFHFLRLFKKVYGRSPHQYLSGVRIEKARLLLEENLPPAEVCYRVGFSSPGAFSTLFKFSTGQTPSQYRTNQLHRRQEISKAPLKFIPNCFAEQNGWKK